MSDDKHHAALKQAVLARFPVAQITYAGPPRPGFIENLLKPSDKPKEYFSGFFDKARPLWKAGFPVFPQSRDRSGRKPSPCVKEIRHLRTQLPSDKEQRDWLNHEPFRGTRPPNAAAVIQDGWIVVDDDVRDERADAIQAIAFEVLGVTPLVRGVDDSFKRALWYRTDSSVADRRKSAHALLTKEQGVLKDDDGKPLDYAIEIIAPGSVMTMWGWHWRSGRPFRWATDPWDVDPATVPVVSNEKIEAFLDAVEERVAPLSRRRAGEGFNTNAVRLAHGEIAPAHIDTAGILVPGGRENVLDVTYDGGKVVDHREQFILKRSTAYILANPAIAQSTAGRHALAGALLEECKAVFAGIGTKYVAWDGHGASVISDCRSKLETGLRFVKNTPELTVRLGRDENGRVHTAVRTAVAIDQGDSSAMSWIQAAEVSIKSIIAVEQDRKRRERALVTDESVRAKSQAKVADAVHGLARTWLDEVRRHIMDPELAVAPIRVGRFPTGAGKTSTVVEELGKGVPGPILFLLPSYANIEEVLGRHKAGLKAKPEAPVATATFKAAAKEAVAQARAAGLNVQVMTGKERGGCLMAEHLKLCREHHAPAMALCKSSVKPYKSEKAEPVYCKHHPDNEARPDDVAVCPVILARRELLKADLIFAPTAFLSQQLPEGLKDRIKGLIVDERCLFELLRYDLFPADVLLQPRPEPRLDKAEREEGLDPQDLLRDRDEIAHVAHRALAAGQDVAAAVTAYSRVAGNGKTVTGPALLDGAIAVAGRAQTIARAIRPNMDIEELRKLLTGPRADYLRQEARFWTLVAERCEFLAVDALSASLNGGTATTTMARGDRDMRIQLLAPETVPGTKTATVRISWISDPTLDEIPTLLLDASADVELVRKAFRGRDVELTDVDAYLHLRVVACLDSAWGTSRFCPGEKASDEVKDECAKNVVMVNGAITNVATIAGQGRCAVFAGMRTREAIQTGHAEPANTDFGHYGALKGLDFAKLHMAAVTVGRHEFPSWIYDAYAACCAYNDETPELPFDVNGDGLDLAGEPVRMPMVERVYALRDGRDLTVTVSEMPGAWGKRIQRQFREEELRQAAGRLRPVYRDKVGTWVAISSCLPEGTIIDAVTTLKSLSDLQGAGKVFEAIRRVGVADPELIEAQAPDCCPRGGIRPVMERLGLTGGDLSGPFSGGMDAYVVTVDGVQRTIQVPAYHGDEFVLDEIVNSYDASDMKVGGRRRVAQGGLKVPSQAKAPDKVDKALGTRDERLAGERELREAARQHVQPMAHHAIFPNAPGVILGAFDPDRVPLDRAMVLARQMGCDGEQAARLGGTAPRRPPEPIVVSDTGSGASAVPGSEPPHGRPAGESLPGAEHDALPGAPPPPRPARGLAALRRPTA